MGIYLNPGNKMFQDTLNGRFVCVSRPRRFDKSVDADMLVAYYTRGADSRGQFAGLGGERVLVGATYDPGTCEHPCGIERVGL